MREVIAMQGLLVAGDARADAYARFFGAVEKLNGTLHKLNRESASKVSP